MDKFWELLERSTLISGVIAVGMIGTACYCVVSRTPVPDYFTLPLGVIIGYFFSAKASNAYKNRAKRE